jgi:hypothetical protein
MSSESASGASGAESAMAAAAPVPTNREFSISDENKARAHRLAHEFQRIAERVDSAVLDEGADLTLELVGHELAGEAPIADVIKDVRSVGRLFHVARHLDLQIPVMMVSGVGPVPFIRPDLEDLFVESFEPSRRSWLSRKWRDVGALSHDPINFVPITVSAQAFGRGLANFLGSRLEGFHLWKRVSSEQSSSSEGSAKLGRGGFPLPGTVAPGGPGFYVELSCVHHHLAAYVSPAYAGNWRNFGAYTTPARSVLPPADWIFGAQGGIFSQIKHDPTPVTIPPNFTPSTTCF